MNITNEERNQIYKSVNIHTDYLYEINKGLNIDITRDVNNLDYEHSPFSLMFFTAPDCQNILNDYLLSYMNELVSIPIVLRKFLVYSSIGGRFFIPILSNCFDSTSFSPIDLYANTREVAENRIGARQILSGNIIQNMVGQDINLSFREVSSPNIANNIITQLLRAWMLYIEGVTFGKISPGKSYTLEGGGNNFQGIKRMINYMASAYYFKLGPDGKTITYYAKMTGIYPKQISESVFAPDLKENPKIISTFQTQSYDSFDDDFLSEFNILASADNRNFKIIKVDQVHKLVFEGDNEFNRPAFYNRYDPIINKEELR